MTATAFLGDADAAPDATDIASNPDDMTERRKPFLLVGSSLAAIFVAGMMALTIALVINIRPTADQGSEDMVMRPGAAAPPALQGAPPAPQLLPPTVPAPPPAGPPPARLAMAQLKELPAPPPQVVVPNAAPAPAAPPPHPGTAALCASAGATARRRPVAATAHSATALLQPAVWQRRRRPRTRARARWR